MGVIGLQWARMLARRIGTLWLAPVVFLMTGVALAQDAAPASGPGFLEPMLLVGFVAIFYFMIWRPQSKRAKAHRELVAALGDGDEVIIGGGMMGVITQIDEDSVHVRIAKGVEVGFQRQAVSAVLPRGTLSAKKSG